MNTLEMLLDDTGRVDELDAAGLARGRAAVHRAVIDPSAATSPVRVTRPSTRRRRLVLTGVAAATVAVAVAVPVVSFGGNGPAMDAAAATLLRHAGAAAGAQPGGWPDAAYWHVSSSYVRDGKTYRRDIWVGHHGSSVLRDTGLPDADGTMSGTPELIPGDGVFDAGATGLSWDQLYALPTDPARLKTQLQADIRDAGSDPTSELFVAVGDLLRESPASPALREALYDVAAGIPGVHVTGRMTDATGRTGTGVTYGHETYVIDPSDGRLLADLADGWRATYLEQGPTADAPVVPAK